MKRILIFVHFNKYNQLADHVIYTLTQLRGLFERTVFVTNSVLSAADRKLLVEQGLIDDFMQRGNRGYDFAAWSDAMSLVGYDELASYDSLTLMNDTCFGPLNDLTPVYERFEANDVDFWGMTNHRAHRVSKKQQFDEHIQSYFKVFHHTVLESEPFREFWQNIVEYDDVQDVIDHYEIKSTTVFTDAGFRYSTVLDTLELNARGLRHPDFSYYAPDVILRNKVPFIKVKAFQGSENSGIASYLLDYIDENTQYPVEHIVTHLGTVGYPDATYLLSRKYLEQAPTVKIDQRVAIHLHVFYPELLEDFLRVFDQYPFKYDLFLTTDTATKDATIRGILSDWGVNAKVIRTGNFGRDIMPFLALKEHLVKYDVVAHFHTKRSLEANFFAGESWRRELITMLVEPADNILRNFQTNPHLGIVIADIPSFFRYNRIVDADNENKKLAPIMNDMWKRMGMRKDANFHDLRTFTMSYGSFFWARTSALQPLFDLRIQRKEVPPEPLPQNTILHAIERILIYLAWDQDLDFRISRNPKEIPPFVDVRTLNQRFVITDETAKDIRLRVVVKLLIQKSIRLVGYRTSLLVNWFKSNRSRQIASAISASPHTPKTSSSS